jgi:hypothetical protein
MSRPAGFRAFYAFYLSEHRNRACRRLHFLGSSLVIAACVAAAALRDARWLWLAPLCGYGCAWIGHFAFEKNRPATFRHPFLSLAGDWMMYLDILRGRVRL